MSDLIDRQAAIDEIEERKNANGYRNVAVISELNRLEGYIMRLPSAQPDTKAQLPGEGTTSDLISRQAAIDVCDNAIDLWHGQLGEGIVIAVKKKIEELLPAQPEIEERTEEFAQNVPKEDLISRKAVIDAVDSETVSTNPEHFKSSEKFIKYMDDADIASFGKWQWANGFNTALVATTIQLKKLPSVQPERKKGKWTKDCACEICGFKPWYERDIHTLSFCPNCGADMRGDNDDQSK